MPNNPKVRMNFGVDPSNPPEGKGEKVQMNFSQPPKNQIIGSVEGDVTIEGHASTEKAQPTKSEKVDVVVDTDDESKVQHFSGPVSAVAGIVKGGVYVNGKKVD